jgi:RNA-directed DNA polymerase
LKAGVLEDRMIEYPQAATPQGGCVSPILANIYLHEVLNERLRKIAALQLPAG